jgi:lysophospholipase L1-like esterase
MPIVIQDHEGVSGDRIDQVASRAASSVPANQPNVILINAGTNDAGQDFEVDSAGQRMRDMIDSILSEVPDALVVLSTLLPSGNSDTQNRVDDINEQFRAVQSGFGGNVVLADMAMNIGLEHIHDGTHPDVEGEQMMSNLWVAAIQSALG